MTTQNLFSNRATAKIAVDVASNDSAITLVAGGGVLFPPPGVGQYFRLVLQKGSAPTDQREYMICTNVTGDVLTVTRAQEGTPAAEFTVGDEVSLVATALTMTSFVQRAGAVLQGALEVEAPPTTPLGIATKQYVDDSGVDDVPNDGVTYGRQFGAWDALGDAAQLPVPIPVGAGGTGGISLSEAQLNLVIARTSIDDLAPASPRYGDRWIKPSNMTELVWVPNQGGAGGAGVWINPMDSQSEAYPIPISKGGTGATTADAALTNLGGTTVGKALFTTASAAAARATLGSTVVGDAVFIAATQAAGRAALGILDYTTTAFKLFDGTVAAPGLAWASEPGLGLFRGQAAQISMAAGGLETFIFGVSAASGNTNFRINAGGGTPKASVIFGSRAGVGRWSMMLGNGDTESGSNSGSNFQVSRYVDDGSTAAMAMNIARDSGWVTIGPGTAQAAPGTSGYSSIGLSKSASGMRSQIVGLNNGVNRWLMMLGNETPETGSNTGSDFQLQARSDTGSGLTTALTISRATGNAVFSGNVTAASFTPPSDERIKSDIEVLEPAADFSTIRPISFLRKADPETGRHYGFSAQNLHSVAPDVVVGDFDSDQPAAIDPVGVLALAVLEIQRLNQRIHQLETQ